MLLLGLADGRADFLDRGLGLRHKSNAIQL